MGVLTVRTSARSVQQNSKLIPVIIYPDEHYEEYARGSDFIRKHIFPGGHLPSLGAIREALPVDSRNGKPLVWGLVRKGTDVQLRGNVVLLKGLQQ